MNLGADIFTVRTGRATVMIGPPASLAAARGGLEFGGPDASQLIDLALEACGETHGVRRFSIRCGLPTHGVTYVGNRGLRDWLVNAVRQGSLAVVLLPDVLFDTGGVQGRTLKVRTDFAMRVDRVMQSQAGTHLRPLEMIEAMQAGAGQRGPGAGLGGTPRSAPTGARAASGHATGGQGRELTPSDVRAMALEDRMLEVIRRMLVALETSADVRRQDLEPLVAPNKLAGTVAVLTAWADTHQGDVRALAGLALRAFGRGGFDEETMSGLLALSQALARTRDALDPDGLEKAANRLARAVTLLGPALESLIACSTTLPVAVPSKAGLRGPREFREKPPEKHISRPAHLKETGDDNSKTGEKPSDASSDTGSKTGSAITPKEADSLIHAKYGKHLPEDKRDAKLGEKGTKLLTESEFKKVYDETFGDDGEFEFTNAFAIPSTGEVFIHEQRANGGTPYHETLHLYTSKEFSQLDRAQNEGTTEYFTRKMTNDRSIDRTAIYPGELGATEALAAIVGDQTLEKAFFGGDIDGLKKELDKKQGEGSWDAYCRAMEQNDYDAAKKALKGRSKETAKVNDPS